MSTAQGTQRRVIALLLLLAALGGLGAVALGAAAERAPITCSGGSREREEPSPAPTAEGWSDPGWSTPEAPDRRPRAELGAAPLLVLLSLLGLALAVLAVWLAVRMRALARPAPAPATAASEDELTAAQARTALAEARDPLARLVDAQDAVIAAWTALERSLAAAGVTRHPSRTTFEFIVEVLAALDLDRAALDDLAALYGRALFDPEPLTEEDRAVAMTSLDRLTAGLEATAAARMSGARARDDGSADGGAAHDVGSMTGARPRSGRPAAGQSSRDIGPAGGRRARGGDGGADA
ncbi:DUF4129 domain-containing protein [Brachybacterium sp. sponge]|uniref:DUF4129 domain-containing protein n=1 Tax=Brachybacterium sp. sponge TaxID=1775432 RepID=UPI0007A3D368|nr:DUF4129 domain-containing protein [Brachybacterium sp. sponge]